MIAGRPEGFQKHRKERADQENREPQARDTKVFFVGAVLEALCS